MIRILFVLSLIAAFAAQSSSDHEKALKDACPRPEEGKANVPKCTDEAVWLIKNEPTYQPLIQAGLVVVLSKDQAAIQRMHNAWIDAVKAHPGDEAVKQNASTFDMLIAQSSQVAQAYNGRPPFQKEEPPPVKPPQPQQSPWAWLKYPPCANPMPQEKINSTLDKNDIYVLDGRTYHSLGTAQGTVEFVLYIAPDGSIIDKTLVRGHPALTDQPSSRRLKNWKYKAVPRTCAIRMTIGFINPRQF